MVELIKEVVDQTFHLVVYHIGGGDGRFGLVERLTRLYGKDVLLIEFEIRSDDDTPITIKKYREDLPAVVSVSRCVSGSEREAKFYINKYPLSSSLLKPSSLVLREDGGFGQNHGATWLENTALDREITVKTFTLAQIIEEFSLPPPDFLSIDAQGVELDILFGAKRFFETSVLGAFTEAEFFEIYEGQKLFHEQLEFYLSRGFRLVEPTNIQRWHPNARMPGRGFATVTEALFVRFLSPQIGETWNELWGLGGLQSLSDQQLVKLIAIARAFDLYSYVGLLGGYVLDERPGARELLKEAPASLSAALIFSSFVKEHLNDHGEDRNYFLNLDFDPESLRFDSKKPLGVWTRLGRKLRRIWQAI